MTLAVLLGRFGDGDGSRLAKPTVRQVYYRWRDLGMVRVWHRGVNGEAWVVPTVRAFPGFRPWSALSELTHTREVARVRLFVEARWPDGAWVSERLLRRREEFQGRGVHVPDALVELPGKGVGAVEVELSRKEGDRMDRILGGLTDRYGYVLYWCAPAAFPAVSAAVRRLGERAGVVAVRRLPSLDEAETGRWAHEHDGTPAAAGVGA